MNICAFALHAHHSPTIVSHSPLSTSTYVILFAAYIPYCVFLLCLAIVSSYCRRLDPSGLLAIVISYCSVLRLPHKLPHNLDDLSKTLLTTYHISFPISITSKMNTFLTSSPVTAGGCYEEPDSSGSLLEFIKESYKEDCKWQHDTIQETTITVPILKKLPHFSPWTPVSSASMISVPSTPIISTFDDPDEWDDNTLSTFPPPSNPALQTN